MGDRSGLIVDYGGVLTTDPFASFQAFCTVEGLAPDTVRGLNEGAYQFVPPCTPG